MIGTDMLSNTARLTGRPVKWTGTRSEVFLNDDHARDCYTRGELALDKDGRFLGMRFDFVQNLGAYSSPNGTYIDMCANLPVIDPEKIRVPTLIMRGQYDGIAGIDDLMAFFADRLKVQMREKGVRHDVVDAVLALGGEDDLVRLLARVEALSTRNRIVEAIRFLVGQLIVESTGTGGGMKLFCAGVGEDTPDFTNASRRIKKAEFEDCQKNGVTEIVELEIGFDGLSIAQSKDAAPISLTKQQLFLALHQWVYYKRMVAD